MDFFFTFTLFSMKRVVTQFRCHRVQMPDSVASELGNNNFYVSKTGFWSKKVKIQFLGLQT